MFASSGQMRLAMTRTEHSRPCKMPLYPHKPLHQHSHATCYQHHSSKAAQHLDRSATPRRRDRPLAGPMQDSILSSIYQDICRHFWNERSGGKSVISGDYKWRTKSVLMTTTKAATWVWNNETHFGKKLDGRWSKRVVRSTSNVQFKNPSFVGSLQWSTNPRLPLQQIISVVF